MERREFRTILEDTTLTPRQKYIEVRASYPSFAERRVCDEIHRRHPKWGRYASVDELVQDTLLEADNVEFDSRIQSLDTNELHYFCLRIGPLDLGMARFCCLIARHPDSDRGTALLLYWIAVDTFVTPGVAWQCEDEQFEEGAKTLRMELRPLIDGLAQRLQKNDFVSSRILFDPNIEYGSVLPHGLEELRRPNVGDSFDEFAE